MTTALNTALKTQTEQMMLSNWRGEYGYTAPNLEHYRWQYLWDSCFHAIIWAELGHADKAVRELEVLFSTMEPSGFLPHINYEANPSASVYPWGVEGKSTITQPPMFGHAIAELCRRDIDIPDFLIEAAAEGLRFFEKYRKDTETGLIRLAHPWESGCDDSPRFADYYAYGVKTERREEQKKEALLESIIRNDSGVPLSNPVFDVCSPFFTALVCFNISELASVSDVIDVTEKDMLAEAVFECWTKVCDGYGWLDISRQSIGEEITLDNMLCLLSGVDYYSHEQIEGVCDQIFDYRHMGGFYGPAYVSRYEEYIGKYDDEGDDEGGTWSGAAWPNLIYLVYVMMRELAKTSVTYSLTQDMVAKQLSRGALRSGFAECWHPDKGTPDGATAKSWAGLSAVV